MDDFNTFEYTVEQKNEGRFKLYRFLLIAFYTLFAAAYFIVIYIIRIIPLGALIPLFVWMLVFFTWKYTKPDYKYVILKGTLSFYVRYGKKERLITQFKLSSASAILPSDDALASIQGIKKKNVFNAIPSAKVEDKYTAIFKNSLGETSAFLFIAPKEAQKLIKRYCGTSSI